MRVVKVMNKAPSIKNIQSYCLRHLSLSPSINSQIVHLKKKFAKREGVQPTEIEIDVNNQFEKLAETVTPLANKPYNVQLKIKRDWSRYVLNQFVSSKKKELCTIESTIPSPVLEGYRNKSEFSIRNGADGNPKTVGTFIGSAGLGRSICVPPTHLINTPQIHKDICKSFEDYIRSSDLPACHDLHDGGFWRPILIRSNRKGECMLCIAVHPGDKTEAQIDEQMNALKDYFTERRDQLQLASLYFQICEVHVILAVEKDRKTTLLFLCLVNAFYGGKHSRCTNESAPYRLLYGEPHLIEKIGGYEFQISPDSFFQVNVEAAEKLYEAIFRVADMKPYSLLLDLCCGTGVVSIVGSSSVRSCVGVDCVLQAVQDATENARINNIQNCAFLKGRIEEVLRRVLKRLDSSADIVAVLNPSRAGMPPDVIHELRNCVQIRKLIYVSCMADSPSMIKNFNWLRSPQFNESRPFNVTRLIPVDLFPHTYHCEAVIVFER